MQNKPVPEWQEYLDRLDSHYDSPVFFGETNPSGEPNITEQFLPESIASEIINEGQLTIDVYEDGQNIYVISPIAGIEKDNLEVNIDNGVLTITGDRESAIETADKNSIYKECFWGRFSRSLVLPCPVDAKNVKANFKNNVLSVILPKKNEEQKFVIPLE